MDSFVEPGRVVGRTGSPRVGVRARTLASASPGSSTCRASRSRASPCLAPTTSGCGPDDEARRFLDAARAEDEHVFVFNAVGLFTGVRAGEIAALEWPDVDLERRLSAAQCCFHGPTKSGRVRYVPILDPRFHAQRESVCGQCRA